MDSDVVKKARDWDSIIDMVIVVMLGITAVLTAWATWVGSLHDGNQAANYTLSTNLASEGNAEYDVAVQAISQDMMLWDDVSNMQLEIEFAQKSGDEDTVDKVCYQLFYKLAQNSGEAFANKIGWPYPLTEEECADPTQTVLTWMEDDRSGQSPFTDEEYAASYFENAQELLGESQERMDAGQEDNANSDSYGLVTVIYSITLFLLGIAGSFKRSKHKYMVVAISAAAFIAATVYMVTLPLPSDFSITSFFNRT